MHPSIGSSLLLTGLADGLAPKGLALRGMARDSPQLWDLGPPISAICGGDSAGRWRHTNRTLGRHSPVQHTTLTSLIPRPRRSEKVSSREESARWTRSTPAAHPRSSWADIPRDSE